MKTTTTISIPRILTLGTTVLCLTASLGPAEAAEVTCPAAKDNTLFEWISDLGDPAASNGSGDFIGAGRTRPDVSGNTQRALMQFDLSAIPAGATITSATLNLSVVDVPKRDKDTARPFWVTPIEGLTAAGWGEGPTSAQLYGGGQGQGLPAEPGDATWTHTFHDTELWPTVGYFGDLLLPYPTEAPLGFVPASIDPTPSIFDPYPVSWSSQQLADDVQAWLDGVRPNFGWILTGQEDFTGEVYDEAKPPSSKRGFASREFYPRDADTLALIEDPSFRPSLDVQYTLVPEPSTWALLLSALALAGGFGWRNRKK